MADSSTAKKRIEEHGVRSIKGRWSEWSMDGNGLDCETKEQTSGLSLEDLAWLIEPHRDSLFAPSDQAQSSGAERKAYDAERDRWAKRATRAEASLRRLRTMNRLKNKATEKP
jgi:hypothetical protein